MEIFLLIVVLAILLAVLTRINDSKHAINDVKNDIAHLKGELARYAKEAAAKAPAPEKPATPVTQVKPAAPVPVPPPVAEQPEKDIVTDWPRPYTAPREVPANDPVFADEFLGKPVVLSVDETPIRTPAYQPTGDKYTPTPPKEGWFDKWLRENPDIEKFIGENLINKIGIGVLVLGIAFFVKYAIDQDWIKEIGRVCIGLFCGGLLVAFAHRLRKNYHSFSSVLAGGGLAVFYFTIALAYHQYQLFSQTTAFSSMVVITAFAVVLSILYDRIELAIIATVGGFLTPFLVSSGQGNYIVLFTYLCILNAGLIALAYYKRWRALNFIAFVFTQVVYLSWVLNQQGGTAFPYQGAFIFGCLFYAMFVAMNVIHHASRGSQLKAFDFIILLSVNLCFYGAGIALLTEGGMRDYKGLFTAALGLVNLTLGWLFFKQSKADKNFIYLIIGITVTYISLAAPVQLQGHYITLFWAAETVVLLWLYQRSFIKLLKIASALVTVLMLASLVMDWIGIYGQIYDTHAVYLLPVIANKGFITGIVCSAAMLLVHTLLKREADTYYLPPFTNKLIRQFYGVVWLALLFATGALEINHQFSLRLPGTNLQYMYLQLYATAFFVMYFFVAAKLRVAENTTLRLAAPFVIFIFYTANIQNIYVPEKAMLVTGTYKGYFIGHVLSVALLLVLIYNTISYVRKNIALFKHALGTFTWVTTIALLVLFSVEVRHLVVWLYYTNQASIGYAENLYSKAGLSIVWGLSSFIIIWLGLSKKYKPLRVIALVVFGITLIKLFAYDIQNIPPAGKIIAFILLGVVLLIVSFMYQRIKKIIIDDAKNAK